LLTSISLRDNFSEGLDEVLRTLTSEEGLGYSRALYLGYDEDKEELSVTKYAINPHIEMNMEKYTEGINGFKFQVNSIKELMPLLMSPYHDLDE